jgi:hypothetical protein
MSRTSGTIFMLIVKVVFFPGVTMKMVFMMMKRLYNAWQEEEPQYQRSEYFSLLVAHFSLLGGPLHFLGNETTRELFGVYRSHSRK